MNMKKILTMATTATLSGTVLAGNTIIDNIIKQYSKIHSVSCVVSRTITFNELENRLLSRVYYERPNKLHVQQTAPLKRRIVCDGTNFFYYIKGDPKGYSQPVDKLSEKQIIELQKIPGSPEDILYRLVDLKPEKLPGNEEFPTQLAYTTTNKLNIIIFIDDNKLIKKIHFFENKKLTKLTSSYEYNNFIEAIPGVFVPTTHIMTVNIDDKTRTENAKFSHYKANGPIPQSLFNAKPFFEGVEFVDSFKKIYEE
jgi:outer membrane lipoprotein-sorting protein